MAWEDLIIYTNSIKTFSSPKRKNKKQAWENKIKKEKKEWKQVKNIIYHFLHFSLVIFYL